MSPTISATPLVVDGYVRVSKVGGRAGTRFVSPVLQREQIHAWAKARGAHVLEVFEELDESGARADRPLLQEAIRRVEAGISQGVVVAVLDRFGRSLVDSLALIDRIQTAGGTFVAVQNGLDLTTDTGRLVLRIMLSLAEYDLDRIRASWDAARAHAIARGVHLGPKPPTGYRRLKSGRLRPDPVSGPVVSELFARRADGESITRLCRFMEQSGVITPYGNPGWCCTSLRGVLANRVYLGEVRCAPHVREGAHPPLTDPVTWQRAQAPRELPRRSASRPSLLAGLVRCAACGMSMSATARVETPRRTRRQYVCARHYSAGSCCAPASIAGTLLEPYVEDVTFELLRSRRRPPAAKVRDAERKVATLQAALIAYRDSTRLQSVLDEDTFADGLAVRSRRVERALVDLAGARSRRDVHELPPAAELEECWPTMDLQARRDIIKQVIDCVIVARGKGHVPDRVTVFPVGCGPTDLPRRGDRHTPLRSLEALHDDPAAVARRAQPRPWSRTRLMRELRAFIGTRSQWPPVEVFLDAGRFRLHEQVVLQGGERWWAGQLGLRMRPNHPPRWSWDDDRIRGALRAYLAGKTTWPTRRQFEADGLRAVRVAINRHGGVDRWIDEFGLPRQHRLKGQTGYWTEQRIRDRLATICNGRTIFPTRMDFQRAGLSGMVYAMQRDRGIEWWARQTGLPRYRFRAGLVPS